MKVSFGKILVLSVLLADAAAGGASASDDCSESPFRDVPPSEREWELLTMESNRFRARLWSSDHWLYLGNPERNADGLRARGGEGWKSGQLAYSDSLVAGWEDIERLECKRGSYQGRGVLMGAMVGTIAFAALHDESWWSAVSVPAGMAIGAMIGATQPIWRAVYCGARAHPDESDSEP